MLKELKDFLMKGNIVDLAVAFIIGVAFAAVINAFVGFIINPIIAAVFGEPDISGVLAIDIGDATMRIGAFLQEVLNFAIIGTVLFFIVKTYNATKKPVEDEDTPDEQVVLLTQIRDSLQR